MALDFSTMDKKRLLIMAAAIGAGLIAMVLTNTHINERVDKGVQQRGSGVSSKEVAELKKRIDLLEKENKDIQAATQQALRAAAQQGTQQPQQKAQPSLALTTPSGYRAVTVLVDSLSAVGGMISPGDFIDIISHLSVPSDIRDSKKAETVTVTLFQNVKVLAVGNNIIPGSSSYELQQKSPNLAVTFALNPQEASLLTFAQQHGKLQFVLRTPLDNQAYILPAATWDTLSKYVLESQGVDIGVATGAETSQVPERIPIEIYRAGGR
jgi:Flp pilus assembly protein CpaB